MRASRLRGPDPKAVTIRMPPMMAMFFMKLISWVCCSAPSKAQKLWKMRVVGSRKTRSGKLPARAL
ncbi:hypothetical protein D3C87_2176140 [compost metagenome]